MTIEYMFDMKAVGC